MACIKVTLGTLRESWTVVRLRGLVVWALVSGLVFHMGSSLNCDPFKGKLYKAAVKVFGGARTGTLILQM